MESTLCIIRSFGKEISNDVENLLSASLNFLIEDKKVLSNDSNRIFWSPIMTKDKSLSMCVFFSNWTPLKRLLVVETPPPLEWQMSQILPFIFYSCPKR